MNAHFLHALVAALVIILQPASAGAQQQQQRTAATRAQDATAGTVVSVSRNTLVVRTDEGRHFLFVLDRDTQRPKALAPGATVRVEFTSEYDPAEGAPTATRITLMGPQPATPPAASQDAIPPEIRRLERDIERAARRYRIGVRAGVGLDPELVLLGAHATLGPIFTRRLLFRPNAEFAYGELTTLFAVNLEAIYRLTPTVPRNRWSAYAGGGPTLGFSHRGFTAEGDDGRSFDFGDFGFNGGLNLVGGVEKGTGTFIELKASIYTDPHVRLLFGVTF
jgi:hypothetical protein